MGVTQDNTDLRRSGTLLGELADLVDDLLGSGLHPRRSGARVGDGGGRNALALAVKSTHLVWFGGAADDAKVVEKLVAKLPKQVTIRSCGEV